MSTLIERLRGFVVASDLEVVHTMAEAADELERLTKENEELRNLLQRWIDYGNGVLKASTEQVAQVIDDGTPEGSIKWIPFSRIDPLKTGDKLYTTPPTALVEQKCLEVAGAVWALAAPDKVVDSKALIAVVHRVMQEGE